MARKKPAKKAAKKTAARPAARKPARKSAPKKAARTRAAKKATKQTARPAPRATVRKATKKAAGRSSANPKNAGSARKGVVRKAPAKAANQGRMVTAVKSLAKAAVVAGVSAALGSKKKPNLDRPRKTVADVHGIPSSLDLDRTASAARTGRAEMHERLAKNTSASPALTSGDVDADWQSAEAVGDEAPGGDNPTPDQDVVDEIGRALGVEYDDDEELQGGEEIADRDRHRWELDPSSKDDFGDEE
ncbi:MAG TPA: DUF6335 family protein [Vicinamibacterales bacterium]|nr:DUF6335 family protein [Vicinamibacterales bacterium]